jgi:cytochrome c peroxidase
MTVPKPVRRNATLMPMLALLGLLPMTARPAPSASAGAPSRIVLNADCPPSYDRGAEGVCRLVTLYDMYTAPQGFGGLRVPLPRARDGFRPQVIDLGRLLFFDPILSRDHDTACANCHVPALGFTDGRGRAAGRGAHGQGAGRAGGVVLSRGVPTLWNIGFIHSLQWDGQVGSLEEQARIPLLAVNEMANTEAQIETDLNANALYKQLFAQAFSRPTQPAIRLSEVVVALTAFEASLVSVNSRYDRYAHGDPTALSHQEMQGLALFDGFVARCSQCHTPPLFTNGELAVIGAPEPHGVAFDHGAAATTHESAQNGAFRVPTLRNIAVTAPYMHSGVFQTLDEVVAFYNTRSGGIVPAEEHLQLHWNIHAQGLGLSPAEVQALCAFLRTLTDESLMPKIPQAVPSGLPTIRPPAPDDRRLARAESQAAENKKDISP